MTPCPKPPGRVYDEEYLAFVRTLRCALHATGKCWGRTEANHVGGRPKGRKCDDDEAAPLCKFHHDAWTRHKDHFAGWTKAQRREWAAEQIDITQATHALRNGRHVEAVPY